MKQTILVLISAFLLASCQDATVDKDGGQQGLVSGVSKIETTINGQKGVIVVDTGSNTTCLNDYSNQTANSLHDCLSISIKDIENSFLSSTEIIKTPDITFTSSNYGIAPASNSNQFEKPRIYSFDELKALAKTLSLDNQMGLENLKMAKLNMRLHYQNLLPHLSINSGVTVLTSGLTLGIISAIGDLVPFLLPTRWIQAKQNADMYKAQVVAQETLEKDTMQMIEGLSLQVVNDAESVYQVEKIMNLFNANIAYVEKKEITGKIRKGRVKDLQSVANQLSEMLSNYKKTYVQDMMELSTAIGFKNPLAIRSIVMNTPFRIDQAPSITLDSFDLGALIKNSLELKQFNILIQSSRKNRINSIFQWLDPAGDPQGGLGAGTGTYVKLGDEETELLKQQSVQAQTNIVKKLTQSTGNYQSSLEAYKQAYEGLKLQFDRIESANDEFVKEANDTPLGELQDSYGQVVNQVINLSAGEFGAYSEFSRMNRLLLKDSYQTKM